MGRGGYTRRKAVRYIYIVRPIREGGIPSFPGYSVDSGAPGISPTERATVDVFLQIYPKLVAVSGNDGCDVCFAMANKVG